MLFRSSTLHQMLKYLVKGKIVTVQGEEEYMVSHLNSFCYVEMDWEFIETPCQNFEEVPQTLALTEVTTNKPPVKMASLKDAKAVVEEGGCTNWGQLPDFTYKTDKFGLGFTTGAQRDIRRTRAGRPPLHISNCGVNTIEDNKEESDVDNWIYPTTNGGPSNWTTRDFIPVSFIL